MPLDLGDWTINITGLVNGTIGTLTIDGVDDQGNVSGSVFGAPIHGKWDEAKQSIAFATSTNPEGTFYSGIKNDVWLSGSYFELWTGGGGGKTHEQFAIRKMLPWYAQPGCG